MKVNDLVKYSVIDPNMQYSVEVGTAVICEELDHHRYLIFTSRNDIIDIEKKYLEVIDGLVTKNEEA
jgi:hypothetical protein